MEKIRIKLSAPPAGATGYEIQFRELGTAGEWAERILPKEASRIVVVSNRKVFRLYGARVKESLERSGFEVFECLIGDGEKYKNLRVLEKVLGFFSEKKLTRTDAVAALGGGVVGDLAGFAASVYLRGVAFLQLPTTLLSMIDSSVGGKTAVNTPFGKNLIGSFYQPRGVLIDARTLGTLPRRELTAGFCEAVKQGALAGRGLFDQTASHLESYPVNSLRKRFSDPKFVEDLQRLVAAQIAFKAEIVAGDERETVARSDARSRKILNFGHTVAHALEKITGYKRFKHGEAVGYGVLVAGEISKVVANFGHNDLKSLNDVVRLTGGLPVVPENIDADEVIKAFAFDKKQAGEALQWVLLEAIGKPVILQSTNIPSRVVKEAIKKILGK